MELLFDIVITLGIALGICFLLGFFSVVAMFLFLAPFLRLRRDLTPDPRGLAVMKVASRVYFCLVFLLAGGALFLPVTYPLGVALAIGVTGTLLGILLWL